MIEEKWINTTEYGYEYDLQKALAYGWKIKEVALTYIILIMEV